MHIGVGGLEGVAHDIVQEVNLHFHESTIYNAIGVLYPQYWLQPRVKLSFQTQLDVLKGYIANAKMVAWEDANGRAIYYKHPALLDEWELDSQQGRFMMIEMSNYAEALTQLIT